MARAGRGELVGINEESSVGVARVEGDHSVVDILLGALAVVTRSQKSAGRIGGQAGFQAGGLGVVVVSIAILFGDVLKNDTPVALNVDGTLDLGIVNLRGAQVTLGSRPVGQVEGRGALGGTSVVRVVESLLLVSGHMLDQIVGRLVRDIGVFLQENGVLADLVGHVVFRILRVLKTEGEVGVEGALGRGFGVAIATMAMRGMGSRVGGSVGAGMVGGRMIRSWGWVWGVGAGSGCKGDCS